MSVVLLLVALVVPESLRVVLAAAGLLGLLGVRIAAANAGWARRGSAHSAASQLQANYFNPTRERPIVGPEVTRRWRSA